MHRVAELLQRGKAPASGKGQEVAEVKPHQRRENRFGITFK